jgi:hypothetical protein
MLQRASQRFATTNTFFRSMVQARTFTNKHLAAFATVDPNKMGA